MIVKFLTESTRKARYMEDFIDKNYPDWSFDSTFLSDMSKKFAYPDGSEGDWFIVGNTLVVTSTEEYIGELQAVITEYNIDEDSNYIHYIHRHTFKFLDKIQKAGEDTHYKKLTKKGYKIMSDALKNIMVAASRINNQKRLTKYLKDMEQLDVERSYPG